MKVWIDLSNSPHALLFEPVARRLENMGHSVFVTARDNAQTVELGRQYWPGLETVGGESPGERVAKARTLADRVQALRMVARRERPDIALSHNSYAQIIAAKLCRIRTVTAMDYEFQPANHLAFRLADLVLLPEAMRMSNVRVQGAHDRKTRYYPGLKEELYLGQFRPRSAVLDDVGVKDNRRPTVVMRTPPTRALYHRFGNSLFDEILRLIGARDDLTCVVLPRYAEQINVATDPALSSVVVPPRAVDSRSLMYAADLVIGAGGTMTREAALLGVPTLSIFAGVAPAVDERLIERGLLARITKAEEILPVEKRRADPVPLSELERRSHALLDWLVGAICETES